VAARGSAWPAWLFLAGSSSVSHELAGNHCRAAHRLRSAR
jgi:hypothetical protein